MQYIKKIMEMNFDKINEIKEIIKNITPIIPIADTKIVSTTFFFTVICFV